ncbi:MAG: DUF2959 domain-containing protein [Thermoanaerobaculia bacterium]|nr:DUF2959 domain-containing protein [Thermoanaerobaculia bacterium]
MPRRALAYVVLITLCFGLTGCDLLRSKARDQYYDIWEAVGREKREMLVKRVGKARNAQEEAQEQFEDALEEFQALTGHDGGDLERTYESLKAEFEKAETRAEAVRERIRKVENVAESLFSEWKTELETFDNAQFRKDSAAKLDATRQKYAKVVSAMNRAASSMDPVLVRLRDQVLYLKHNLNAQALGSLDQEVVNLQGDVNRLIADIQASITEADRFIAELDAEG